LGGSSIGRPSLAGRGGLLGNSTHPAGVKRQRKKFTLGVVTIFKLGGVKGIADGQRWRVGRGRAYRMGHCPTFFNNGN